jgi:hypothetical protein
MSAAVPSKHADVPSSHGQIWSGGLVAVPNPLLLSPSTPFAGPQPPTLGSPLLRPPPLPSSLASQPGEKPRRCPLSFS